MSRTKKKSDPEQEQLITSINKTEILPFGTGMKLVRLDIPLTNEFLEVLTELCKIRQRDLKQYVTETLYDGVDLELTNPQEIGNVVCKNLKEIIRPDST